MTQKTRAEQIEFHKAELAKLENPVGRVKPEMGQKYYSVNAWGDTYMTTWSGDQKDNDAWDANNAHLIADDAPSAHDERVARVADQDAANAAWTEHGTPLDWSDGGQPKWSAYWCWEAKSEGYMTETTFTIQERHVIYFPTDQSALKSVEGKGAPV